MRTVTHLFNAMRPFLHRDPGIVGAALARDDVIVQLILDGVHLAPETAIVTWRAAPGRVALVTDSITAAGESDGALLVRQRSTSRCTSGAVRGPDGVLAGSVLTMIEAVQNLHALGVPLAEAVGAATAVPARVLGPAGARPPRRGPAGRHRDPRRSRYSAPRAGSPCSVSTWASANLTRTSKSGSSTIAGSAPTSSSSSRRDSSGSSSAMCT